jgi:hypothetical protein
LQRIQSFILTDTSHDLYVDQFNVGSDSLRLPGVSGWSIARRTLRGGLREGVEALAIDNGALAMALLPTRGMGLWRGHYNGWPLAWEAPVIGPVHPRHVSLGDRGGLGWLAGFDELLCRCGLSSNGPPGEDVYTDKSGRRHRDLLNLHGRIANQPAHYLEVRINLDPPHELTVVGRVEEGGLFSPRLTLTASVTTVPGSNRLVVHDVVENRGGTAAPMQMLYHINIGGPLLEAGSRMLAPFREMAPRDARAAEGMSIWDTYAPPTAGFAEQVYLFDLMADAGGRTLAMLQNRKGDRAVVLRCNHRELPCFSLWKNTAALEDGYVTGLEPATNYPNFRAFERENDRMGVLPPGGRWEATMSLEFLDQTQEVLAIQREIARLQAHAPATIHPRPHPRFSPA